MDVLVDHSGYDLLNLGDVAMLQSCVQRLSRLLPSARLHVVCHDPAQLARYCPQATPVVLKLPGESMRPRTQRARRAAEFGLKAFDPLAFSTSVAGPWNPVARAAAKADVVVAGGGGYVTDRFFWHGAAVLGTLSYAQRRGVPTAMFGQGLGPIHGRVLRHQARRVLPRLRALGLREQLGARSVVADMGLDGADFVQLTGDDALCLATSGVPRTTRQAIGVNLRVAGYTEVNAGLARDVGAAVAALAQGNELVVLPVSRYATESDLHATAHALAAAGASPTADDLSDPTELIQQVARCRMVITTSYHAAVFALAQGLPTVCLTSSAYYDGKFLGLRDLYGPVCTVVDLREPVWRASLREAADRALTPGASEDAVLRTRSLVASCDALYERFVAGLD
jgi:polysaccharide pyruvyl transferase WcaK-like protein